MEKEQLVIDLNTSLLLRGAGINAPAYFSYYAIGEDGDELRKTGDDLNVFAAAYTMGELMEILPGAIEMDDRTFISDGGTFVQHDTSENTYRYAELTMVKTAGGAFMTAYFYEKKVVGFRKTSDSEIDALTHVGNTPLKTLSQMALSLSEHGRIRPVFEK